MASKRAVRDGAKSRAHSLALYRKRSGLTQQTLDRQYAEALRKNPQAANAGGRR